MKVTNLCRNPPGPSLIVTYALPVTIHELVNVKLPATISENPALITGTDSCVHPAPYDHPPVVALLPIPVTTLQVVVGARVASRDAEVKLSHLTWRRKTFKGMEAIYHSTSVLECCAVQSGREYAPISFSDSNLHKYSMVCKHFLGIHLHPSAITHYMTS